MTTEEKKKLRKVLETVFRDTKMWSSEFGANQNIFKLTLEFNGINFGTYRMILRMRGDNPIMALVYEKSTYVNSGESTTLYAKKYPTSSDVYTAAIQEMYRIGIEHAFKSITSKITTVAPSKPVKDATSGASSKQESGGIPISLATIIDKRGKPIVPKMEPKYLKGYLKTMLGSESNWTETERISHDLETYELVLVYNGKRLGKYLTFIDYENNRIEVEFRDTRDWSFHIASTKLPSNSNVDRAIAIENTRLAAVQHAFDLITIGKVEPTRPKPVIRKDPNPDTIEFNRWMRDYLEDSENWMADNVSGFGRDFLRFFHNGVEYGNYITYVFYGDVDTIRISFRDLDENETEIYSGDMPSNRWEWSDAVIAARLKAIPHANKMIREALQGQ